MVDAGAVERTERWVAEAVADGARVLTSGSTEGLFFGPTVSLDAPATAQSGIGREGLRWAIEDMTELKLMVLAQPG